MMRRMRKLKPADRKAHPLMIRMTKAEHDTAIRAAKAARYQSVSEWMRYLAREAAENVLGS